MAFFGIAQEDEPVALPQDAAQHLPRQQGYGHPPEVPGLLHPVEHRPQKARKETQQHGRYGQHRIPSVAREQAAHRIAHRTHHETGKGPKKYPARAMGTASMENRLMAEGITVVNRANTTLRAHKRAQVATTRVAMRPFGGGPDFFGHGLFGHKKVLLSKMEEVQRGMCGLRQLSCPRGRWATSVFGPNGRSGSRPAAAGHPAQAVAENSSRGTAPSPAGNLPSERYLTRNLLLPATLDNCHCIRFFPKMQ